MSMENFLTSENNSLKNYFEVSQNPQKPFKEVTPRIRVSMNLFITLRSTNTEITKSIG